MNKISTKKLIDELISRLRNSNEVENKILSIKISRNGIEIKTINLITGNTQEDFYNLSNLNKATWLFDVLDDSI